MANEKKPEGQSNEPGGGERPATNKRPALGDGVERSVKRTGAVPKWSTGPMSNLDDKSGEEKSVAKRSTGKQAVVGANEPTLDESKPEGVPKKASGKMAVLGANEPTLDEAGKPAEEKSVAKKATGKVAVLGGAAEKSVSKRGSSRGLSGPQPLPTTQPEVEVEPPGPPAKAPGPSGFAAGDAPLRTSTEVPVLGPAPGGAPSPFALPKPPAGYRPDDDASEKTSTADAVPVAPTPPPSSPSSRRTPPTAAGESRDGSTVIKAADDIKSPDKPEVSVAKAFQAPKPPVHFRPDVAVLKTTLKPPVDEEGDDDAPPTAKPRVAEEKTNIKDIAEIAEEGGKPLPGFDGKTALVPSPVGGEIKKTAAAEAKARELAELKRTPAAEAKARELRERDGKAKGAVEDRTGLLPTLDGEEETTTSGASPRPDGGSGDTLPPDAPAVGADGKPLDPKLAGAFSRAKSKEQVGFKTSNVAVKPPLTRDQKTALGVVAGGAVLIFVILVASVGGMKDRPSAEDLERCYPYGTNGANGPNGLRAPPAVEVKYKFDQELDVPIAKDFEKCVVVKYEGPGANATTPFQGSMVVCKRWDKIWQRGNDDGMPFRISD